MSCFFNANIRLQSFLSFYSIPFPALPESYVMLVSIRREWLCFGCTPLPICLEYPGGWRATGAEVVVLDVWQRGHYSCYRLQSRASSRLAHWGLVSTRVRLSGRRTSSGGKKNNNRFAQCWVPLNDLFFFSFNLPFYGAAVEALLPERWARFKMWTRCQMLTVPLMSTAFLWWTIKLSLKCLLCVITASTDR